MKTLPCRSFLAIALIAGVSSVFANEYKSVVIEPGASTLITVDKHEIVRIRNFSQEGGDLRGSVTVTTDSGTATALTATILSASATPNPTPTPTPTPVPTTPTPTPSPTPAGIARVQGSSSSGLEPINSVIIAGPATVSITAGDVPAFVTFRKEADSD
jgi:hypothetical protein